MSGILIQFSSLFDTVLTEIEKKCYATWLIIWYYLTGKKNLTTCAAAEIEKKKKTLWELIPQPGFEPGFQVWEIANALLRNFDTILLSVRYCLNRNREKKPLQKSRKKFVAEIEKKSLKIWSAAKIWKIRSFQCDTTEV